MPSLTGRGAGEARVRLAADFEALRLPQSPGKVNFHISKMGLRGRIFNSPRGRRHACHEGLRTHGVKAMSILIAFR
jgi:hypothetical protein